MKFLLVLLAIVAVSSATRMSLKDRRIAELLQSKLVNRAYEQELRDLLEKFRAVVVNGDEEQGIPILDPFEAPSTNLTIDVPETAVIKLFASTIAITGLKDFVVNDIGFSVLRLRLDYDFSLPIIKVLAAYYELDGNLLDDFKLFGTGAVDVEALEIGASGYATVTLKDSHLFMNHFEIAITLGKFNSNISGLLGGGEVSDVLNSILEELVPGLIETQAETISSTISGFVVDFANGYLTNMTLGDLIDIITGGGSSSTTAAPKRFH